MIEHKDVLRVDVLEYDTEAKGRIKSSDLVPILLSHSKWWILKPMKQGVFSKSCALKNFRWLKIATFLTVESTIGGSELFHQSTVTTQLSGTTLTWLTMANHLVDHLSNHLKTLNHFTIRLTILNHFPKKSKIFGLFQYQCLWCVLLFTWFHIGSPLDENDLSGIIKVNEPQKDGNVDYELMFTGKKFINKLFLTVPVPVSETGFCVRFFLQGFI